jgi:hypothetical protein
MDELVERVMTERELRGWSVRRAAAMTRGLASNTTWGNWERDGGPPSPKMRRAVVEAFGWDADWVENPPPRTATRHDPDVLEQLAEMRDQIAVMAAGVDVAVAERQKLVRTVVKALRLLTLMEARQRRAFDLLGLDPSVDLDDARLDDPDYRASFEAGRPAGRARPRRPRPVAND